MFSHGSKKPKAKGYRQIETSSLKKVQTAAPETAKQDTSQIQIQTTKLRAKVGPLKN